MKRHSKRRFLILLIFVACAVTILVSVFMNYNENGMEKINRGHVNKMVVKIENEAKEIENKVSESSIEMVTVFLNEDVSEEYAVEIEEQIKTIIGVKTCKYFTKEEAWNQFADKYFWGNTSLAKGFKDDNPKATLRQYQVSVEKDKASNVVQEIESIVGINRVNIVNIV